MSQTPPSAPPNGNNDRTPAVLHYSSLPTHLCPQALICFLLGLFAIPLDLIACIGAFFGFVALFFGIAALDSMKNNPQLRGKPLAIIGMICAILSMILPLPLLAGLQLH